MGTTPSKNKKKSKNKQSKSKSKSRSRKVVRSAPTYPLWCEEWSLVCSQTVDKWKIDPNNKFFSSFLFCNYPRKPEKAEPTWRAPSHTFEIEQKKDNSILVCRSHDQLVKSVKYGDLGTLEELLSVGKIERAMPSTGGYISMMFSLDTLADSTVHYMYICGENPGSNINFSVDRTGNFQMDQCIISPDGTRVCLVLSDQMAIENGDHDVTPTRGGKNFDVQIYSRRPAAFDESFCGNMFEIEYQISGLQAYGDCPMLKFDPRYYSSRLWLVNVKSFQFNEFNGYIKGYNIDNKQVKIPPEGAASSSINDHVKLLDCVHSPDGAFLVTLVFFRGPDLPPSIEAGQALQIYDSDSLEQLKIITLDSNSSADCFANFLPVFSQCSRKIALRTKKHIKVYQLPRPKSLQALSRVVVLHSLGHLGLDKLCAPRKTVDYLQYKPMMQ